MKNKLTARRLMNEGLALVTENFGQLFSIALVPILVTLCLELIPSISDYIAQNTWAFWTQKVIYLYFTLLVSIMWMQYVITGQKYKQQWFFSVGMREIRYLFAYVVLWWLPALLMVGTLFYHFGVTSLVGLSDAELRTFVEWLGLGLLLIFAYYLLAVRWLLVFPSIATGASMSPLKSWHLTKGHWWLLLRTALILGIAFMVVSTGLHAVFAFFVALLELLSNPLNWIPSMGYDGMWWVSLSWLFAAINMTVGFALLAWIMSVPALCYKYFQKK